MKILIISKEGDGLGVGYKMVTEGHVVDVWIQEARFKNVGKGLVGRPVSWREKVSTADLIIVDMVGFGHLEALFKRKNKVVFSLSKITDMMELDREKGIKAFEAAGIKTPETMAFSSPDKALAILEMWKEPGYAIKPDGNIDTAKTYIVRDKETFGYVLGTYSPSQSLIVQRIVEGIEVSTEGWWNGRDWIKPFNHTFEEKRFLPDGMGSNTGCMGNVVIVARGVDKLVEETVMKMTTFLKKTSYRGPIDINTIVDKDNVYGLEFTCRLGYDAIEALSEGLLEPLTDLIFETAVGVKKEMKITRDFMISVRMSVPPWPYGEPEKGDAERPILGLNEHNLKHVFLTDVRKRKEKYEYAAGDGVVLKATARGRNIREAQHRVYRTLNAIDLLDKQYRMDIGDRVDANMKKLKEWGYL